MNVLIATGLYPPEIGGPATYVKMLEAELPQHEVVLQVLPFTVVRTYPKAVRHAVYTWKLWRLSRRSDIVFALDPVSVGLPAAIVATLRRRPFLLRLGGDYAWEQGTQRFGVTQLLDEFVRTRQPSLRVRTLQRVQTWVTARAQTVIVPSKYLGSIVEQWGIDKNNIKVIHSALLALEVTESKDELRKEFSFTGPTIVTAGRMVSWKGFAELIEVAVLLRKKIPGLQLVIVGDGPEEKQLKQQVAERACEDVVSFTGRVSKAELGKYKKAADVFVLNTGYEGLSHELLEVMALGTPIVTTNVGGNPELITNEREGLLVPYKNTEELQTAIERVLRDPHLQQRLVLSARARTQQFTTKQAISQVVELLQSTYE